jgi:nucleotide-binding universal stress UspA family protein
LTEAGSAPALVQSILHPSDFGEGSESAFAHALAIALLRKTQLTIFHTDRAEVAIDGWSEYPAIRKTLERWGMLPPNSPRSAVFEELGIEALKVGIQTRRTTAAIVDYLDESPADLIVMATRGSEGLPHWVDPSVAERIARKTRSLTLFVPKASRGFVAPETGDLSLRRVVVAVDHDPSPAAAVAFSQRAARLLGTYPVEISLVHVGSDDAFPTLESQDEDAFTVARVCRDGDVVDAVLAEAEERSADLIVMTTQGHQGFLDALRGSTTEQVLRRAPCPLLAVPTDL